MNALERLKARKLAEAAAKREAATVEEPKVEKVEKAEEPPFEVDSKVTEDVPKEVTTVEETKSEVEETKEEESNTDSKEEVTETPESPTAREKLLALKARKDKSKSTEEETTEEKAEEKEESAEEKPKAKKPPAKAKTKAKAKEEVKDEPSKDVKASLEKVKAAATKPVQSIAQEGKLTVTKMYKKSGVVESEESEDIPMDIKAFQTSPAHVSIRLSKTINMGNYESLKVDVGCSLPCYLEEMDEAYEKAIEWAGEKLQEATAPIMEDK